jgi:precorrin-6A/cobalt-precorrin-6A reductase
MAAHVDVLVVYRRGAVAGKSGRGMKILILGGTEEARALAEALVQMGHEVTTSLAGRTSEPMIPKGELRIGGFGGPEGLANYIHREGVQRLVDASHPYAVQMAHNAVEAARAANVPLVRLLRPAWSEPQYAFWHRVGNSEDAAAGLPPGAQVMLTVGHKDLGIFLAREDCSFVVRTIEPMGYDLPPHAQTLVSRPPYFVGAETELLKAHGITHLITKNSGGVQTEAKLRAAQQLRIAVVMIARPELPVANEVMTVGRAIAALKLGY